MVAGGIAVQRLRELPAIVDQHCAETDHPLVEVRQQLQEIRPLLTVPQNAGLVVIERWYSARAAAYLGRNWQSAVSMKRRRAAAAPPGSDTGRPGRRIQCGTPDSKRRCFWQAPDFTHYLPPPVSGMPHPSTELPVSGGDPGFQHSGGRIEGNHLPVRPGPGGFPAGEVDDGLQQIGLALGVLPKDHITVRVKGYPLAGEAVEMLQRPAQESA